MTSYIVDTAALRSNLEKLRLRAGTSAFWAVLKGNGYGLGLVPMAEVCRSCGITRFAVTEPSDVRTLRGAGFTEERILLMRPVPDADELRSLLSLRPVFTVSGADSMEILSRTAAELGVTAEAHIKIDTGMGRYGFLPDDTDGILRAFAQPQAVRISGIYTHFCCAFCDAEKTRRQYESFLGTVRRLREAGCEPGEAHVCNSSALLRFPDYRLDAVRIGSAILGRICVPDPCGLQKIGRCETQITEVRELPKGSSTGYGSGWTAKRPTRIAVLPVGYWHGFGASYGNDLFRTSDSLRAILSAVKNIFRRKAFYVTIAGRPCRVLGHIGMLHCTADVTDVSCRPGDPAVLDINPLLLKGMDVRFL